MAADSRIARVFALLALCASAIAAHGQTVRGLVTFARPQDRFAFMAADDGVRVRIWLPPKTKVKAGDVIEATGEAKWQGPVMRMDDAAIRKTGEVSPPDPVRLTIADLYEVPEEIGEGVFGRLWYGMPVEAVAKVLDVNRRRTQVQLVLSDVAGGEETAVASMPLAEGREIDEDLKIGAIVRVRGAPSMAYDRDPRTGGYGMVRDLVINLDGGRPLEILSRAPWWTPARTWAVTGAAVFVAMLLGVWIVLLKRTIRAEEKARAAAAETEDERRRLAQDLHDEFQQFLAGSMFMLDAASSVVDDPQKVARQLIGAKKSISFAQASLRNILWNLQEAGSDADTLGGLFRYAARRMPHWAKTVEISEKGKVPLELRRHGGRLLMILQEAVGNALRHGKAGRVKVRLASDGIGLKMTVRDDGAGFDAAKVGFGSQAGFGIPGMKRRAEEIGAAFSIVSKPGSGTVITVTLNQPSANSNP